MKRFALIFVLVVASGFASAMAPNTVDYDHDVLPIFQRYCVSCHAEDDDQGGLVIESFFKLMHGGEGGAVVTPGSPTSSRLLLMASGKLEPKMPPENAEGPSESELAVIATWIEQGAIGPDGDVPLKRELRTPVIPTVAGVVKPITAIAASSNGKLVAIARYGSIEIATMFGENAKPIRMIPLDAGKVNSLEFSRDGSRLLVASGVTGAYGVATLYSIESGGKLSEFIGHRDSIFSAVFSPDEMLVATGGYDREILLWNVQTGEPVRELTGHNGAITDLAFSPDGKVLVSASSDETAKVWHVESGNRLDTLSQSEGEVLAVDVTADGRHIVAGSADNRLRVWKLVSTDKPRINPIVATRFIDDSPIVNVELTSDGTAAVVLSEAGNIKVIRQSDWQQVATLGPIADTPSDVCLRVMDDASIQIVVASMDGTLTQRELPLIESATASNTDVMLEPIYLNLGPLVTIEEAKANDATTSEIASEHVGMTDVLRGAEVMGTISGPGEVDRYRFVANRGEVWAIDADAIDASRLDPIVTIQNDDGAPVLRTRLQAVRDSYFTFRGKDSMQSSDFRLFAWEEMNLDDYLYSNGEVTRLWMHPRGPDSGFNVYPGTGDRWTYFGTSHVTHALGEPAYVVQPLAADAMPTANGLPVFDIYYENDDDPARMAGKNSRLLFTAPADAHYTVCVTDTRSEGASGEGKDGYAYRLKLRAAEPTFTASVSEIKKAIRKGSGRECTVSVNRTDGFDGEVEFNISDLPPGVMSTFPVTIQAGQREAYASVWAEADCAVWEGDWSPTITATAHILGMRVERSAGTIGKLALAEAAQAIASIVPVDAVDFAAESTELWTLSVARGETVSARVVATRDAEFKNEIGFGKEFAGRNTTHGVYVDNIGLNGLLLLEGELEREFFITADPIAKPGKRLFYLVAEIDGGVTTRPIVLDVLP